MSDAEILDLYKSFVPFAAQLCGSACEIVLHDISNPEASVIAIENGFNSGRHIGSPLTDLARDIINTEKYKDQDYVANYSGVSQSKDFVSSTFFIKNGERLIGLLCVNRDLSAVLELENAMNHMKSQYNIQRPRSEIRENLNASVDEILPNLVSRSIEEAGVTPKYMTKDDRIRIVNELNEQGVLKMKGAVKEVARQLLISEPTVYRYLKAN